MVYLGLRHAWAPLVCITLAQTLINLYPIMHLRLARHRLERLAVKRPPRPPGPTFRPPSS
jgi:hypothetical protein